MTEEATTGTETGDEDRCIACERVMAVAGIGVAVIVAGLAVDLLTGGKITALLGRVLGGVAGAWNGEAPAGEVEDAEAPGGETETGDVAAG